MRSYLTRHVFRAILYSESCNISYCPCITSSKLHHPRSRRAPHYNNSAPFRRSIFGFSRKPDPWLKEPDIDAGFDKMLDLTSLSSMHDRPPPADELIEAFNVFFRNKLHKNEPLQEIQAYHAARTLKYLQENNQEQEGFGLTLEDLEVARYALVNVPRDELETHNKLARTLFEEIKNRKEADSSSIGPKDLLPFVAVLCQTGDALEARGVVMDSWKSSISAGGKRGRRMWTWILKGLAQEKNEQELVNTVAMMEKNDVPFGAEMHEIMTTFYASRDDVQGAKKWYSHPIASDGTPSYDTNVQIMRFCIRNSELDWGEKIFRSLFEINPRKTTWDVIFQWAAATGKGVDEIDRMMEVMVKRNPNGGNLRPDIDTINGLIEYAISKNDPYTAERYIALGQKWRVTPSARTYILQMDYRMNVGDMDGVRATYSRLLGEDVKDGADFPVVNKYIRALCNSRQVDHEQIMRVAADLNERKARLEPETISALCILHLHRGELPEIITLIKDHTYHYSMDQRAQVANTFITFILDENNSTDLAWDAYTLLIHAFDETAVDTRVRLMEEFFRRKRADMASHVFGNIRQHRHQDDRPTVEAYVKCFAGIAGTADVEALEMVHNMLKLDSAIEPSTRLYNALMLAYSACSMPDRSLEFWEDIAHSIEGPSVNGIRIAFRACEASARGKEKARSIWDRLNSLGVFVSRKILIDYLAVLAAHGALDEAFGLVEMEMHKPNVIMMGVLYNSTLPGSKRDEMEKWIKEKYPDMWEHLVEKVGWKETSDRTANHFDADGDEDLEEEEQGRDELLEIMSGLNRGKIFDIDRTIEP
ncbi:MAG: hypothetical protein M1816_006472 [Peltula sp. TS41687]|nr:MAG: hypothetical protein M1816_006472 [Peltula sp. TS41687]